MGLVVDVRRCTSPQQPTRVHFCGGFEALQEFSRGGDWGCRERVRFISDQKNRPGLFGVPGRVEVSVDWRGAGLLSQGFCLHRAGCRLGVSSVLTEATLKHYWRSAALASTGLLAFLRPLRISDSGLKPLARINAESSPYFG